MTEMDIKNIFETIDSLSGSYVSVWEDVCNIESPTQHKSGVDEAGCYFAKLAESHGWDVDMFCQPVSGDVVCITLNSASKERPLCLSAHLDTVHPVGSFGMPAVRRDDEKIYGPGVTDCKGGAVAAALAMDALARAGFDRRPIHLLLQSDEEVGSRLSNKETINTYARDHAMRSPSSTLKEAVMIRFAWRARESFLINSKFTVSKRILPTAPP